MQKNTQKNSRASIQYIGHKSRGFTLLFASLVGALVLAVGLAILNISIKQLTLSNAGRATQQSFYTADAAIECALLLDRGSGNPSCGLGFFPRPTTTAPYYESCLYEGVPATQMGCMGKQVFLNPLTGGTPSDPSGGTVDLSEDVMSTFEISDATSPSGEAATYNDMCFTVVVTKKVDGRSVIQTRGYNTCKGTVNRYERAIRSVNQ